MRSLRVSFVFVGILAVSANGCARTSQGNVVPGKTTRSQLTSEIGSPVSTAVPSANPASVLLDYHSDCSFQADSKTEIIQARICEPHGQERTLQYWRHKWRGVKTTLIPVAGSSPHSEQLVQLQAPQLHTTVVYDPSLDRVVRVVNYGQN
ncbi:MAG: hypothetical protein ACXWP5_03695 [Bdellovibrionota bacterium]